MPFKLTLQNGEISKCVQYKSCWNFFKRGTPTGTLPRHSPRGASPSRVFPHTQISNHMSRPDRVTPHKRMLKARIKTRRDMTPYESDDDDASSSSSSSSSRSHDDPILPSAKRRALKGANNAITADWERSSLLASTLFGCNEIMSVVIENLPTIEDVTALVWLLNKRLAKSLPFAVLRLDVTRGRPDVANRGHPFSKFPLLHALSICPSAKDNLRLIYPPSLVSLHIRQSGRFVHCRDILEEQPAGNFHNLKSLSAGIFSWTTSEMLSCLSPSNLPSLESLELTYSHSMLYIREPQDLIDTLSTHANLRTLVLQSNQMRTCDLDFGKCVSITCLDVACNDPIAVLPPHLVSLRIASFSSARFSMMSTLPSLTRMAFNRAPHINAFTRGSNTPLSSIFPNVTILSIGSSYAEPQSFATTAPYNMRHIFPRLKSINMMTLFQNPGLWHHLKSANEDESDIGMHADGGTKSDAMFRTDHSTQALELMPPFRNIQISCFEDLKRIESHSFAAIETLSVASITQNTLHLLFSGLYACGSPLRTLTSLYIESFDWSLLTCKTPTGKAKEPSWLPRLRDFVNLRSLRIVFTASKSLLPMADAMNQFAPMLYSLPPSMTSIRLEFCRAPHDGILSRIFASPDGSQRIYAVNLVTLFRACPKLVTLRLDLICVGMDSDDEDGESMPLMKELTQVSVCTWRADDNAFSQVHLDYLMSKIGRYKLTPKMDEFHLTLFQPSRIRAAPNGAEFIVRYLTPKPVNAYNWTRLGPLKLNKHCRYPCGEEVATCYVYKYK